MNKYAFLLKENFHYIALSFLIMNFFQSCNRDVNSLSKKIVKLQNQVDTLTINMVTIKDLQLEGLRSEKRMIQSVDRKLFDLEREKEIDVEITKLVNGKPH
jgi:hypothetical protein